MENILHYILQRLISLLWCKKTRTWTRLNVFFTCIYTTSPLGGGQRTWRQQKVIYNADDEDEALLVIRWAHGGSGEGGWGTSLIGRDREWGGGVIQTSLHTDSNTTEVTFCIYTQHKLFFSLLKKRSKNDLFFFLESSSLWLVQIDSRLREVISRIKTNK